MNAARVNVFRRVRVNYSATGREILRRASRYRVLVSVTGRYKRCTSRLSAATYLNYTYPPSSRMLDPHGRPSSVPHCGNASKPSGPSVSVQQRGYPLLFGPSGIDEFQSNTLSKLKRLSIKNSFSNYDRNCLAKRAAPADNRQTQTKTVRGQINLVTTLAYFFASIH